MKEERFKKYTIKGAKELDLVAYLSHIGFDYVARFSRGKHYCYISPFRTDERTPSFKIEKDTNHWVDFGKADGVSHGNIIDFGIAFYRCSVKDFLARLSDDLSLPQAIRQSVSSRPPKQKEGALIVREIRPLMSSSLLAYAESRGVTSALVQAWCCEVDYSLYNRMHTAIGFKNDQGGYDLRNAINKHSSIPKTFRMIASQGAKSISVFEGFMDFLSYLSLPKFRAREPSAYLVLNSTTSFEKALPILEQFEAVRLYLDQDATGRKCTERALSLGPKYRDESQLFAGRKDLNEYLVSLKRNEKQALKQSL